MQALKMLIVVAGFVALVAFSTNAALIAIGAAVVAALVVEALRQRRDDDQGTRSR